MKKFSKKFLFILVAIFVCCSVHAQQMITDLHGNVVNVKKHADVAGTSYFGVEGWSVGTVTFGDNTRLVGVQLNYDLVDDALHYQDERGNTVLITAPVPEFSFSDPSGNILMFKSGFPPIGKMNATSFYQVLVDGDAVLLKRISKSIQETISYGSSTKEKSFYEQVAYYIYASNEMSRINNRASFTRISDLNTAEMTSFIRSNNLNFRNEQDLISLVRHFNSL